MEVGEINKGYFELVKYRNSSQFIMLSSSSYPIIAGGYLVGFLLFLSSAVINLYGPSSYY